MAEHILKVVAPYFDALWDSSKTFEVRRNDRGFQKGDRLVLWEYDGSPGAWRTYVPSQHRAVTAEVGFVYAGDPRFTYGGVDALAPGHVVLALVNVERHDPLFRSAPQCGCPPEECNDAGASGCYFGSSVRSREEEQA